MPARGSLRCLRSAAAAFAAAEPATLAAAALAAPFFSPTAIATRTPSVAALAATCTTSPVTAEAQCNCLHELHPLFGLQRLQMR